MKKEEKTILEEIIEICNRTSKEEYSSINTLKRRIGENLFKIRREKNLTLTRMSELSGIKRSRVDWLERGVGCMNLNRLIKLSNFYEVDITELFR